MKKSEIYSVERQEKSKYYDNCFANEARQDTLDPIERFIQKILVIMLLIDITAQSD